MARQPKLIIQVPRESRVELQLAADPPPSVANGDAFVEVGPADAEGKLEPPAAGQVVLALPSAEGLEREADTVHRVIGGAGAGTEPLVVVVDVAEELREEELAPLVEAAGRTARAVILRVIGDD
ncbi:MAG TPA: hypothetical protein VGI87_02445 [Solirubrobacteraceae bacterium]